MVHFFKKSTLLVFAASLFISGISIDLYCQSDKSHFSKTFNREKPYRIFLPADYSSSQKHYPVIYYFHGNTGSHELDIPGVEQLVNDNEVIVVAWNGRSVDSDLRPYNIGNHSNINFQVQFKDYFLETEGVTIVNPTIELEKLVSGNFAVTVKHKTTGVVVVSL